MLGGNQNSMKVADLFSYRCTRGTGALACIASAFSMLAIAVPAQAQESDISQPVTAPAGVNDFAAAPAPNSEQIAAYAAALAQCRTPDGAAFTEERVQHDIALLHATIHEPDKLFPRVFSEAVESNLLLIIPLLPHYAPNFDALSEAQQNALEQDNALGRIDDIPADCGRNGKAALPVLRWLADNTHMPSADRKAANLILGLVAKYVSEQDVGVAFTPADQRRYFLKALLFTFEERDNPYRAPRFWSDGVDNDIFANLERQGLMPFFDASNSGVMGYYIRDSLSKMTVRTNPEKTRSMLQSGDQRDVRTLIRLEDSGLLEPVNTEKELSYWYRTANKGSRIPGSTEIVRDYVHGIEPRLIRIAAALNNGTLPVSDMRPTAAESYVKRDPQHWHIPDPTKAPFAMRALVAPNSKVLLVEKCGTQLDPYAQDDREASRIESATYRQIKQLPSPMRDGAAVFGWVVLPTAATESQKADCQLDTLRDITAAIARE